MSRLLDDLSTEIQPKVYELLARCVEAGLAVMIVDTLRTEAEQIENVRKGVSWTMNSRHLPRRMRGYLSTDLNAEKSDAIDVCPYSVWDLHGPDKLQWDRSDPVWKKIGAIGESIGLKWGVIKNGEQVDPGHFEMKR